MATGRIGTADNVPLPTAAPIEAQVEATVLRRVAEASDQAEVSCLLASSDADFVTRLTIDVTGGV